ncbi:MAG: DUF1858 domain-containing protein [Acholeplasmataceae bacterium]|nr:DUF1858 domain-containing protein [Acholeplasmataceae bacterium]
MKTIHINQTIQSLVSENPEIKDILFELGFRDIVKPGMIQTVGRFMTLKKGIEHKNISLETVKNAFKLKDFIIAEENNE